MNEIIMEIFAILAISGLILVTLKRGKIFNFVSILIVISLAITLQLKEVSVEDNFTFNQMVKENVCLNNDENISKIKEDGKVNEYEYLIFIEDYSDVIRKGCKIVGENNE